LCVFCFCNSFFRIFQLLKLNHIGANASIGLIIKVKEIPKRWIWPLIWMMNLKSPQSVSLISYFCLFNQVSHTRTIHSSAGVILKLNARYIKWLSRWHLFPTYQWFIFPIVFDLGEITELKTVDVIQIMPIPQMVW